MEYNNNNNNNIRLLGYLTLIILAGMVLTPLCYVFGIVSTL